MRPDLLGACFFVFFSVQQDLNAGGGKGGEGEARVGELGKLISKY